MQILMNLSVALEAIPQAMGRTRAVLVIGLIGSWAGQVPGVFALVYLWRKDLVGLFTGMVRTCVALAPRCVAVADDDDDDGRGWSSETCIDGR
jgi:hypothetical protein